MAIGVRVVNLTAQSLWADEGNSVRLTERSLDLVVAAARADVHPPGYYVLLWGWVKLFGQGESAVRALSVVVGVALVGLVYLIGHRLFGPRVGWLAALCAAISPFQVQYSQEVRMYILVAFLGAGATYAFVRWIGAQGQRQRLNWSVVVDQKGGKTTQRSCTVVEHAWCARAFICSLVAYCVGQSMGLRPDQREPFCFVYRGPGTQVAQRR
jgi:predicted membrane-bound mannosyltransferase